MCSERRTEESRLNEKNTDKMSEISPSLRIHELNSSRKRRMRSDKRGTEKRWRDFYTSITAITYDYFIIIIIIVIVW